MATKIKFNFKKAKFKIAWLKALEEEIKNVMSIVEPQIESQSTKNINTTNSTSLWIL